MGITKEHVSGGDGETFPKAGGMQVTRISDELALRCDLDHVVCEYIGMLAGGAVFDGSHGPGKQSFSFEVGVRMVVPGLDEGIKMLSLGEKAILTATPDYGYGAIGFPPIIPPNSTLVFEIRLLNVG